MALGTTADLNIRVDATTAQAEAGLARLQRSTLAYESSLRRAQLAAAQLDRELEQKAAQNYALQTKAMEKAGRGLLIFGGATAAGLGLSAKAAIDWESAWTGVLKTVDGSPAQLAAIEKGLRDLATTLPTSHDEIAAVAEAAGQLGVKGKDIVSFTKVMIDLGQTTNLSADQAATAMARFSNIMQTPQSEVDRLGSSLVALGNDGASTEAEILTLGNRIAAAGQLVGLSEGEVLGLANAMSSLGVEAESGGTAISMTLREISSAVASGSDDLDEFARIAGMSTDQFGMLFSRDAASATEAFTSGLGRIKNQGEDVNATLAALGITGVRQVDTLLRLAQSGDLLTDSLQLGNEAYQENSALTEEAGKRYETTAAKMQIAKNQVVDLGIALGENLLPALGATAGALSDVSGFLGGLPGPVKTLITTFGVAAAAVGILGGATLSTVAKYRNMKTELAGARESFANVNKGAIAARTGALALAAGLPILTSALGGTSEGMNDLNMILGGAAAGFAITGGPWGAAIGAGVGLLGTLTTGTEDAAEAQAMLQSHIQEVSGTLNEQTGALTRNTEEWVSSKLAQDDFVGTSRSAFDSAEALGISLSTVREAAAGNETAFKQFNAQLSGFLEGKDPTNMGAAGIDALNLSRAVNESRDSVEGSRQAFRQSAEASDEAGTSYDRTGNRAADAAKAVMELVKAEREAAEAAIQNKRDQLALISTMQSAREEARKGKKTLEETTKAGQDNWAALLDLADQWNNSAAKVRTADGAYKNVRQTFIDVAREMGASEQKAKDLADRFLSVPGAARKAAKGAEGAAVDIGESLRGIPDEPVNITLSTAAARTARVLAQLELATGGPVYGAGTATSDSIPALLSNGERVTATRVVNAAGRGNNRRGQQMLEAIETMILRGEMGKFGDVPFAFAEGGAVVQPNVRLRGLGTAIQNVEGTAAQIAALLSTALSREINQVLTHLPAGGALGPGGVLTPAQAVRGYQFLQGQAGKPYEWAGVGPSGYDCSGLHNAGLNAALGRYPYSRTYGATGNAPWAGSSPGPGQISLGWFTGDPGHMSGNWLGTNVESSGGIGVRFGGGARSPVDSMFNGLMHYDKGGIWPHGTLGVNMSGGDELVINPRRFAEGGAVTGKAKKPASEKPLTDAMVFEIVAEIRDAFGRRSALVDIIQQWLEGLKRGELTQKALLQRVTKAVQHAVDPALRQFSVGPGQDRGETRGEVKELIGVLKELFGPDAPVVRRVEHLGDRLLQVQDRQDRVAAAYERANDKLAAIVDRQRQFAAEVRAAFSHDAFSGEIGSVAESLLQLRADANDAQKATRQFRRLGRKGLDDAIIRELAASGNTALLQQLSTMTPKQIAAYERAFRRRGRALGDLGDLTGRQVLGDERRQQIKVTNKLEHRLGDLNKTLNKIERRLEHRVERGAEKGVRKGLADRENKARRGRRAGVGR